MEQGSLRVVRWRGVVLRNVVRAMLKIPRGLQSDRQLGSIGPRGLPDLVKEEGVFLRSGFGGISLNSLFHRFFDELLQCLQLLVTLPAIAGHCLICLLRFRFREGGDGLCGG